MAKLNRLSAAEAPISNWKPAIELKPEEVRHTPFESPDPGKTPRKLKRKSTDSED